MKILIAENYLGLSSGNFNRIEGNISHDEFGSVIAAINSMKARLYG